jgi:hypothetical protein
MLFEVALPLRQSAPQRQHLFALTSSVFVEKEIEFLVLDCGIVGGACCKA